MAERVGFEPTIPVKVCPLSRRIVSTTHAPLRVEKPVSWLTAIFKERLQQIGATASQDSSANLNFMVQLRVIQHLHD